MNRLLQIFRQQAAGIQTHSYRHTLLPSARLLMVLERHFGCTQLLWNRTEAKDAKTGKTKTIQANKITLLTQNQSVTITTLEDASKLAKRRDLHLVQVQEMDNKTQRPVYKLVKAAELITSESGDAADDAAADKDKTNHKKSDKTLTMGARIADHDLQSRIKNITKWLNKQHEVRILLQANSNEDMVNCERIAKSIEQAIKEPTLLGKIVQKRTKGTHMKFSIVPLQGHDGKIQTKPS